MSYWAAAPIDEIAGKIKQKFEDYQKWMNSTGYSEKIKASYKRYYGLDEHGTLHIRRDKDDIARIDVNHMKSLIKRMHIMITEAKLAYQPRALNSDSKSQVQSDIGRGLCDYYGAEKNMNGFLSSAVLAAIIMHERVLHAPWDISEGMELAGDDGQTYMSGDQKFEAYSAADAARNTASSESPWWIIRQKVPKYDLAVLHPDFEKEILASRIEHDINDMDYHNYRSDGLYVDDDDYTYKYIMYHERTPAVPQGRWVEVCAGQVLRYGSLRYKKMPVVRLKAGDVVERCFADSPATDLVGIQEGLNALFSGSSTNALNNALQLIYCQDPELVTRRLETGQILVSAQSRPEGLSLNGSNAETNKLIDIYMQHMQLLSGVNDVARGNPSSSLKSGASLAVVLAQAIQYVSDLQKNYAWGAGELATILINNVQEFGPEEFIGYVAGTSRKGQVRKFKKRDILDIARVTVDLGNPLTQVMAGRYELAQNWAQLGIMKNPKQIESFIRTGELDQVTEDDFSDALLIRDENENIKRGEIPPVLLLDNHAEHIIGHKAVFSTPEAREDLKMVEAGLAHIKDHINKMRQVPPDLAAVITGQPLPPLNPEMPQKEPNPTINGARMPSMPEEAPPEAEDNYNQALDAAEENAPAAMMQ